MRLKWELNRDQCLCGNDVWLRIGTNFDPDRRHIFSLAFLFSLLKLLFLAFLARSGVTIV